MITSQDPRDRRERRGRKLAMIVVGAVADLTLQANERGEFVCPFHALGCEATTGQIPVGFFAEEDWDEPHSDFCPVTLANKLADLPDDLAGVTDLYKAAMAARKVAGIG